MHYLAVSLSLLLCFSACNTQEKSNVVANSGSSTSLTPPQATKAGKRSIGEKLKDNDHLPIEERIALFHQLKKEQPTVYAFDNEDDLTMYGYTLLWSGKAKEAFEVFKLIVSEFPNSANPYDSLAEAYLELGDKDKALANYKKSVEMNPQNYNGIAQIQRIEGTYQAPPKPGELFDQVFTAQQYREDLDEMGQTLLTIHPNALKFISKKDFQSIIEAKKDLITNYTTYGEFVWHCNEVMASVSCSHTSLGGFYREWEMLPTALRFPLEVRWINDQLFVVDNANNLDKVAIKDEILSINGIAVAELISDIFKHIPSQGHIETSKRHDFNEWAVAMIPYALQFPESYQLVVNGKPNPITLNAAQNQPSNFEEPFKRPCPENLCLEFLDNNKTAILTIASFNYYWWNNLSEFEDFIDQSFAEIREKEVKNLIIDVRFNGGGSYHSSIHLLKYLTDQPFEYYSTVPFGEATGIQYPFEHPFTGKLYFMIDGNGNSTTGHFMSIVKDLKLGTIVGEELGSNQFCTAGQAICRLPNTGLEYYVANSTCISSATSLPDETGILPDHYVTQRIDDYLKNIDTVKEFTLGLTR